MRTILSVLIILCLTVFGAEAQQKIVKLAKSHIDSERYSEAIRVLQPLISSGNTNGTVYLYAGIAYLSEPGGSEHAITLFDKAIELLPLKGRTKKGAVDARYYKMLALHQSYRFDEAFKQGEELLSIIPRSDTELLNSVNRELTYARNAIELVENPVSLQIQNMGRALNSQYMEHSPVVSLDESTIFFTSNRPQTGIVKDGGGYFESIYVSYWRNGSWTEAQPLQLPGSYYGNRATVSVSADGNSVIFYQNDGVIGNLYESRLVFGQWTEPTPFPAPINSGSNETHASLSLDGQIIVFTSDRPGGYGGKDIYISYKLPDGSWGTPINLGPNINTDLDEDSPFLHPDGVTLYFSSEGHNSMGGHDIFYSVMDEKGEWGKAVNMGYPVNTVFDDKFFLPTPDGQRVYYASSQQNEGYGDMDIYLIALPHDDERSLAVVSRFIYDEKGMPFSDVLIRVYDNDTNTLQGVFRPNTLSGKFVAVLNAGMNYRMELEAQGYERIRETFKIDLREVYGTRQRAFYLDPIILKPLNSAE